MRGLVGGAKALKEATQVSPFFDLLGITRCGFSAHPRVEQEERSGPFLIGEEMPEKSLVYGMARSVCKRAWTCDNGT